jgi:hypothetical protein
MVGGVDYRWSMLRLIPQFQVFLFALNELHSTLFNFPSRLRCVSNVKCPNCSELRSARSKRRGFFQVRIMTFFGYYPWECRACGVRHFSRQRGEPQMKRRTDAIAREAVAADPIFGSASIPKQL